MNLLCLQLRKVDCCSFKATRSSAYMCTVPDINGHFGVSHVSLFVFFVTLLPVLLTVHSTFLFYAKVMLSKLLSGSHKEKAHISLEVTMEE